jgi:hypothetical protein
MTTMDGRILKELKERGPSAAINLIRTLYTPADWVAKGVEAGLKVDAATMNTPEAVERWKKASRAIEANQVKSPHNIGRC